MLAVWLGLGKPDCNDPQAGAAAPQLRLQLTPAALASLVTVAENVAVPFTPKRVGGVAPEGVGGGVVMLIAIGAGTICTSHSR